MKRIEIYIKKAAQIILHSQWFSIVSAIVAIGTLVSFLICCLLQQFGFFDTNPTWAVVWLFSALTAIAFFFLITWAAIVVEACFRIDED